MRRGGQRPATAVVPPDEADGDGDSVHRIWREATATTPTPTVNPGGHRGDPCNGARRRLQRVQRTDFVDDDGDGVCNSDDLCPGHDDATTPDTDGDGICERPRPLCFGQDDASGDADGDGLLPARLVDGLTTARLSTTTTPSEYPGAPEICATASGQQLRRRGARWHRDRRRRRRPPPSARATATTPTRLANPGGTVEICDGIDNDCDSLVPPDEIDDDGDGFDLSARATATTATARLPGQLPEGNGRDLRRRGRPTID